MSVKKISFNKNAIGTLLYAGNDCKILLIDDKTVFKKFYDNPFHMTLNSKEGAKKLVGIKNDTYTFPEALVYDNGKYIGYTMKYHNKKSIVDVKNFKISDLKDAVLKVEEDTQKIADLRIFSFDVNYTNILYKKRFNIIDCDSYYFADKKTDINDIWQRNMVRFNTSFINGLLDNDNVDQKVLKKLFKIPSINNKIERLKVGRNGILDVITAIEEEVKQISNQKIETFCDLQKTLKKAMK